MLKRNPTPPSRAFVVARRLATALLLVVSALRGFADERCQTCPQAIDISGDFHHWGAGDFEEIVGPDFMVTVPHLMPGKYRIIIGEAESYFTNAEQRLFDIVINGKSAVANFDIFSAAGGANKFIYLTNDAEPLADATLTIKFHRDIDNAKFDTLEMLDSSGGIVLAAKAVDFAESFPPEALKVPSVDGPEIWKDSNQPLEVRVQDLIRRLSLVEKVHQLRNDTPAIPRLGIPTYDYWSEGLHGVARNGIATVFPQAIGMAATWDLSLIHREGEVIATEGRAKFNEYTRTHNGNSTVNTGLTFWSPNINIFRDPRWGRGQETYGEDTFLTGQTGVAFIRGLQGDDPNYFKAVACAKHFAVHSGPEPSRHTIDVSPPERDFYETYLPHFEMAVREGHVGGFMGAYNSVFGKPACANPLLLTEILRRQWRFDGYVVSDCGAINDIYANHKFVSTPDAAAAVSVKAGCDICCGGDFNALIKAVQNHLITEKEIDGALAYALKTRFRLGLFDPPDKVPFSKISIAENDTPEHQALALQAARESIVLLKNDGLLPLDRARIKRIAVIGANGDDVPLLLGNYNGEPSHPITILNGVREIAGAGIQVVYEHGCPLASRRDGQAQVAPESIAAAVDAAKSADVVIYVGGISPQLEGEEMSEANGYDGFRGGDRTRIELPSVQENFLKTLQATGKPVVFVNCSGSAIAMPWEAANLPAILQVWYPGEQGGRAVAEVLFGDVNPSGRLPVTFYRSTDDLPPFEDYSMKNRTYRYFTGQPLYAFGHGLSYTRFDYSGAKLNAPRFTAQGTVKIMFTVKNRDGRDGDEVAQVYFRHVHSAVPQAKMALCGFARVHLSQGKSTRVVIEIPAERLRYWDVTNKRYTVESGEYELLIGGASDDVRLHVPFEITPSS